jgi:lysophospholipase L1-like esterase
MNQKALEVLPILLFLLIISTTVTSSVYFITKNTSSEKTRIACVGDSLTAASGYPYYLWMQMGLENSSIRNFGHGSTTISLNTETPYMETDEFQKAIDFQPNIVIIMLGTNDAQPNLELNNVTLTEDYVKLIKAFQDLPSTPEVWVVLPPPIYSNQTNVIDAQYFNHTVIPCISQAANQTDSVIIDVYSALLGHPECYKKDGVHITETGAEIIANTIYKALTGNNPKESYSLSILGLNPFFKV